MIFHLWPKSFHHGKTIGLTMTVFNFLLHALPGLFLIGSPEPPTKWISERHNTANSTAFNKWISDTGDRLQLALISFLPAHWTRRLCLILFEDTWVAKIVAKFPNQPKEEDSVEEAGSDPEKEMSNNPGEDQDADAFVYKKGNNETESDLQ